MGENPAQTWPSPPPNRTASRGEPGARGPGRRHRALIASIAGSLAIALVAAALWFFWLPGFRPPLRPGETYGIDVSAYQGHIDWRRVADQDVAFAYIKATEGGDYVDPRFAANWSGAGKAGVPHGAYHFFSLCTPGPAQARNFLNTVPAEPGALPPAVDLELSGNCHLRPGLHAVGVQLSAFLRLLQRATGRTVVVYLGDDFARRYPLPLFSRHPLWLRRILLRPAGGWTIWQVDGNAHIGGIHGDVDLDVGRFHPTSPAHPAAQLAARDSPGLECPGLECPGPPPGSGPARSAR